MRRQLRPFRTTEEDRALYSGTYPGGYRHDAWPDHLARVDLTVRVATRVLQHREIRSIADLSCGDGGVAFGMEAYLGSHPDLILGDLVDVDHLDVVGALPDTLRVLEERGGVDAYVCSETLEHLVDPDNFLQRLRASTRTLVLSTPAGENSADNLEHYWEWDSQEVERMLRAASFVPLLHVLFDPCALYVFQVWVCE